MQQPVEFAERSVIKVPMWKYIPRAVSYTHLVAFTRDPATGEKKLMGEFLINAQGEDVVAGCLLYTSCKDQSGSCCCFYRNFSGRFDSVLANHQCFEVSAAAERTDR